MSNFTLPLAPGVLSQPNLEVFPAPFGDGLLQLVQLDKQECFDDWIIIDSDPAADTYGPWVEGIPSTIRANLWFSFCALFFSFNTELWTAAIDIGVGAAGLEVPVVSEIPYQWGGLIGAGGSAVSTNYTGPIVGGIPAGSRVSLRHKDNTTNLQSSRVMVNLLA